MIGSLQNEVRILVHLAGKVDAAKLDYRPTPKQRSTIELLRYLTVMGPAIVKAIKAGSFDGDDWTAREKAAEAMTLEQGTAAIAGQGEEYAAALGAMSDADLRRSMELFGSTSSCGGHLVNLVLSGYAAYRTQLFLYLKACGREELNTWNLWVGMDEPAAA